jgi:hypothetical protein
MAEVDTFGKIKSVTVHDESKKGEVILVTTSGNVTLKISDDHESAFNGMVALITSGIPFGIANPGVSPNFHVRYDDSDMEIDELTLHNH